MALRRSILRASAVLGTTALAQLAATAAYAQDFPSKPIKFVVPFKGASEAVTAVVSGTVDMAFAEMTSAQELVKSGKLRALVVASDKRVPAVPAVPTASEAGLPGFTAYTWVAAAVSAKTPKAETAKLAELLSRIETLPETRVFYENIGAEVMQGGPEEMRTFQNAEIQLWKRIAVKAKVEQQ